MKLTRRVLIEEVYELPGVTCLDTAKQMLKSAERRSHDNGQKAYEPLMRRVVQKGHWHELK